MQSTISKRELARLSGWDRKKISEVLETIDSPTPTLEEVIAAFMRAKSPASEGGPGLFSLSELTRLSGLDRATVSDRVEGIASHPGPKGSKRYSLPDVLPALIAGRDVSLDQAKIQKARADAGLAELNLKVAQKKFVDYAEARTEIQEVIKALHRRLAIQFWRENAARLRKTRSAAELAKLGQDLQQKVFDALRTNYKALLGSD